MATALPSSEATDPTTASARLHWEDFVVGETREFGHYAVTREAVLDFARQFDPQPFHLDDTAAAGALFGRLAASGGHTCAMAMRLMCDGYLVHAASLGSPGIDRLAWPTPVFPGDVLRMRSTVLESRPLASRPGVGLVRSKSEVLNQNGEIVLAMEGVGFYARRAAAAAPPR